MPNALWPSGLFLVRHGESAGNVASDAAHEAGLPVIDIAIRDMDVPLSALGERQAAAVGRWIGALPEAERPRVVYASPYVRARTTAEIALDAAGLRVDRDVTFVIDERLREREFGILDRLTRSRRSSGPTWASSTIGPPAVRAGPTCCFASAASSTRSAGSAPASASSSSPTRSSC